MLMNKMSKPPKIFFGLYSIGCLKKTQHTGKEGFCAKSIGHIFRVQKISAEVIFEIIGNGMVTENDYIDILFISTKESLTMLDIRLITSRRECWIRTTALKKFNN